MAISHKINFYLFCLYAQIGRGIWHYPLSLSLFPSLSLRKTDNVRATADSILCVVASFILRVSTNIFGHKIKNVTANAKYRRLIELDVCGL